MGYYDTSQNEITYPHIVMEQIQIIQKIYSKELRDGDKILKNALGEQMVEGEDTRYSFLQAVEFFGLLLEPYFLKKEKSNEYKGIEKPEFDEYSDLMDMELIEALEYKEFTKKVKEVFFLNDDENVKDKAKKDEVFRNQINLYFLNYKITQARKIFRQLIQLYKDQDFLATQSYTDSDNSSMVYDESKDGSFDDDEERPI